MAPAAFVEMIPAPDNVQRWRFDELVRAGYPKQEATDLSVRTDIELHAAVRLLRDGCPLDTAMKILR